MQLEGWGIGGDGAQCAVSRSCVDLEVVCVQFIWALSGHWLLQRIFLKPPSLELLEGFSSEQLLRIADHFEFEIGDRRVKESMRKERELV